MAGRPAMVLKGASTAPAPWFVYLLECVDGSLYAGATNDVARRVAAHNAGRGARYTRGRRPVRLVFHSRYPTKSDALRAEARLKQRTRAEKLALVGKQRRRKGVRR